MIQKNQLQLHLKTKTNDEAYNLDGVFGVTWEGIYDVLRVKSAHSGIKDFV